tara:strand:- start:86 stop:610 length:525 start_codon:yes stop_codon:yes gene_type:complete
VKKYKVFILIIFFFTLTNYSYSQNIVYANLQNIISNSEVGKKIISYFSEENKKLIDEFKAKEKAIIDKEQSLISQKSILQSDEYINKVKQIENEIKNFNTNRKEKINKINLEREEVSKSFRIEINKILKEFAESNNIDIILSSNQMLIGKSNLDVTNELLKIVNEKIKNFNIKK